MPKGGGHVSTIVTRERKSEFDKLFDKTPPEVACPPPLPGTGSLEWLSLRLLLLLPQSNLQGSQVTDPILQRLGSGLD